MVDQHQHLIDITEGQERDEAHEGLTHTGSRLHKMAVDAVQQQLELFFISTQLGELLQKASKSRLSGFSNVCMGM